MIIYKITNITNGKIYIGQDSKNNPKYLGSGKYLKQVIKKYGKENFTKEILQECKTKEELDKQEQFWIKKLNSTDKIIGYNLTTGGGGSIGSISSKRNKTYDEFYGKEKSIEIRQKLSLKKKNYIPWNKGKSGCFTEDTIQRAKNTHKQNMTDEIRKKISDGVKRSMTKKVRQYMSDIKKGKKQSPESIEKMRQSKIGIPRSIETKLKISKSNTGKKHSLETKLKMKKTRSIPKNNSMFGKHHTEKTKQKISLKNKGRVLTQEHKLKISQTKLNKRKLQ